MVVVAKLKAIPGKEAQMEKALLDMIPKVAEEEGTIVYTLHRDQKDPSVFLLYEKYKNADARVAHRSTPHYKELFDSLKIILDGDPEVFVYKKLAGINE